MYEYEKSQSALIIILLMSRQHGRGLDRPSKRSHEGVAPDTSTSCRKWCTPLGYPGIQTHRPGTGPKAVGMGVSSSPIANLRAKGLVTTIHPQPLLTMSATIPTTHVPPRIILLGAVVQSCHFLCNIFIVSPQL